MPITAQSLESDQWKYKILKQKYKLKGSIIHKVVEYYLKIDDGKLKMYTVNKKTTTEIIKQTVTANKPANEIK